MKALVYKGPKSIVFEDAPDPLPGEGEALIRIEAAGICGSDMHAFLGHDERRPAPLILGHEAAGTVLTGALAEQRVTVNPLVTCGTCEDCRAGRDNLCGARQIISMPPREGAFAGMIAMPERNLLPIPDDFPAEKAALAEPLACGWHAIKLAQRALFSPLAETRAIILGGGAIGVGAALVLAAHGARDIWIAETNEGRRRKAETIGPFRAYDPRVSERLSTQPIDLIIDAFGGEATRAAASAIVRPGGVIMHIGLAQGAGGLDVRRMTLQEIAFIGTYTYTAEDFRETARAIVEGRLGALDWMATMPLADGAKAFADSLAGAVAAPKIILRP
ncbi:MAG: alcohol dehydrogenase catalytic domain-containing protein [Rhodomicrobium sp.]|nr:alcohol dehydrogenase catalytic domain-containing protein [Rhodomicrobium sp.]